MLSTRNTIVIAMRSFIKSSILRMKDSRGSTVVIIGYTHKYPGQLLTLTLVYQPFDEQEMDHPNKSHFDLRPVLSQNVVTMVTFL